jgi:hypothetical protein
MSRTEQARQTNWAPRIQSFPWSTDELRVVLEASWVPSTSSASGSVTESATSRYIRTKSQSQSVSRSSGILRALSGPLSRSSSRAGQWRNASDTGRYTPSEESEPASQSTETLKHGRDGNRVSGRTIGEGAKHRRVLAVVSHKDHWDLTSREEGWSVHMLSSLVQTTELPSASSFSSQSWNLQVSFEFSLALDREITGALEEAGLTRWSTEIQSPPQSPSGPSTAGPRPQRRRRIVSSGLCGFLHQNHAACAAPWKEPEDAASVPSSPQG